MRIFPNVTRALKVLLTFCIVVCLTNNSSQLASAPLIKEKTHIQALSNSSKELTKDQLFKKIRQLIYEQNFKQAETLIPKIRAKNVLLGIYTEAGLNLARNNVRKAYHLLTDNEAKVKEINDTQFNIYYYSLLNQATFLLAHTKEKNNYGKLLYEKLATDFSLSKFAKFDLFYRIKYDGEETTEINEWKNSIINEFNGLKLEQKEWENVSQSEPAFYLMRYPFSLRLIHLAAQQEVSNPDDEFLWQTYNWAKKNNYDLLNVLQLLFDHYIYNRQYPATHDMAEKILQAIKEDPTYNNLEKASAYQSVAEFYYHLGSFEKAKLAYEQVIKMDKDKVIQTLYLKSFFRYDQIALINDKQHYLFNKKKNDLKEQKLKRWHDKSKTLLVYIEKPNSDVQNWNEAYGDCAFDAFTTWNKHLKKPYQFKLSQNSHKYDIKVSFKDRLKDNESVVNDSNAPTWQVKNLPEQVGYNIISEKGDYYKTHYYSNDIVIFINDPLGKPHSKKTICRNLLHEAGHSFGIQNHSDNPLDVMFTYINPFNDEFKLSQRDITTLQKLYSLKPEVTNTPGRTVSSYGGWGKNVYGTKVK